jgi:endonuclease V-like protein UPF0215 family
MKKEIRILGIDDAPFDKFKDKNVLVVGTVFRGGSWLDGVLSTKVKVDGNNSTKKLIEMINKCKFKPQIQCVILDGIAFGGFNIVDVEELNKKTKIPVIIVIRGTPDFKKIKSTLKKLRKGRKYKLIEKAGEVHKVGKIYIQINGISLDDAKKILKISCTRSLLPEPIRAAHIIAAGIVLGESKGQA